MDHDLLADYVGGALEGTPEHERVAGLIATSPEWERAADELTAALYAVQIDVDLLRHTAEPMPEDVAARFEGLFDGPRRDPLEPRVVAGRAKVKRWKRWAAPVAIAAAALGVFAIGKVPTIIAPTMSDADSGNSQMAANAPAAVPLAPVPTVVSWQRYDRSSLGKARNFAGAAPYSSVPADTAQRSATEKAEGTAPAAMQRLLDRFALQQCLSSVNAVLPGRVDLVEYAYFEGSPALVISITSIDGRWWFVAGPNCGQLGPDEQYRTPLK